MNPTELDAGALVASIVISTAGMAMAIYGKKQRRLPPILGGVAMMAYPYFIPNVWLMMLIAGAIVGLVAYAKRFGL